MTFILRTIHNLASLIKGASAQKTIRINQKYVRQMLLTRLKQLILVLSTELAAVESF